MSQAAMIAQGCAKAAPQYKEKEDGNKNNGLRHVSVSFFGRVVWTLPIPHSDHRSRIKKQGLRNYTAILSEVEYEGLLFDCKTTQLNLSVTVDSRLVNFW